MQILIPTIWHQVGEGAVEVKLLEIISKVFVPAADNLHMCLLMGGAHEEVSSFLSLDGLGLDGFIIMAFDLAEGNGVLKSFNSFFCHGEEIFGGGIIDFEELLTEEGILLRESSSIVIGEGGLFIII
eukprot:10791908-Ditylum_brightwellii.AAC.1